MNKHKVGDKFIVNIKEVMKSDIGILYRADFSTLVFDDYGLDALQKIDSKLKIEDIDDMIAEYDLRKTSYNQGLNDAWELLRKLSGLKSDDFIKMYDTCILYEVIYKNTPQEALAKLKAYEEVQNKMVVGDVIKDNYDDIAVAIDETESYFKVLTKSGCVEEWEKDICKKTGKHIDISSILEQIGE